MRKLKLLALDLGATAVLSREQLKNILGGIGAGSYECGTDKFDACVDKTVFVNCCYNDRNYDIYGQCQLGPSSSELQCLPLA
ncbi:hypothetical protein [Chitinophaga caseinilytica]|uniref:hypothetical protein n=1 Tax=Chitinophaga caseinilytica TaxID=2267521 RepID=UPI003C2CAC4F